MANLATVILPQSSGIEDWAAFYADLEKKANIPNASSFKNEAGKVTFRDAYLNLQEIKTIVKDLDRIVNVVLYADTLEIPEFTRWVIKDTSLIIYARNIIVHDNIRILIDYQNSNVGKLILFGKDINQKIRVNCIFNTKDNPQTFNIEGTDSVQGIIISAKNTNAQLSELKLSDGTALFPKDELLYYLNNAFIYSSLLYDQNTNMALSMLLWIKALSSQSVDFQNLFYRSTSLASLLQAEMNAKDNGARFVPYLTSTVYENLSEAFTAAATQFESHYMTLSTQEALTQQNIDVAKTMVENTQSEIDYVNALLEQAKQNSDDASAAVKNALENFEAQDSVVKLIAIDFENLGIPEYKRDVIRKGMLDIVTSLITFGVSVGLMATGNPTAAAGGAASAAKGVQTVKAVAESGVETAELASSLAETMEKLAELIETIEKAVSLAQTVKTVVDGIENAESQMSTIQELDDFHNQVDISSADNWTIFQLQASSAMEDPIDLGIRFAKEYDEAMQILAIYGQALSAAQLASMKADQELAAVYFQLQYAEDKKENLKTLVNNLQVGKAATLVVMQEFYQKYLDSKSSLFTALKLYKQSFFYWSFSESVIRPKIIDSVQQLNSGLTDLTQIAMDKASALERFNPPPQEMKNMLFSIEDEAVLEKLKREKKTNWILPLSDSEFLGLERIRLDSIRIWIEGIRFNTNNDSVFVTITNTGNYLDCYKSTMYQFNSKKLIRTFKYRVMNSPLNADWKFDNNTWGLVQIDGKVDQEVTYAYFRPTPFSEWSISLQSNNSAIDLSNVSKITMYFEGTAIGSTFEHAQRLREKSRLNINQ